MTAPAIPEPRGDWLRPLDAEIQPVTHVRGTAIAASRDQIKAMGQYDRYLAHLPSQANHELVSLLAPSWVPVALVKAHYDAIDHLDITAEAIENAARAVAVKLHGVLVGAVAKAARASGANPLSVVRALGMLWPRTFRGGALGVRQTAMKEGFVYFTGTSLLASRYLRVGLRSHVQIAADIFSERALVREQSYKPAFHELVIRVQWV
jgi:hypothetical protein